MPLLPAGDITLLLRKLRTGDAETASLLLDLIYPELRRLARRQFRGEAGGHLLQPTALVHEAFIRLLQHRNHSWRDRAHFLGATARIMRRVLIEHARAQDTAKRNRQLRVSLDGHEIPAPVRSVDIVALDEALVDLERLSERQARVVEMRFFAGMTIEAIAVSLRLDKRTVDRDWAAARAWLRLRLQGPTPALRMPS